MRAFIPHELFAFAALSFLAGIPAHAHAQGFPSQQPSPTQPSVLQQPVQPSLTLPDGSKPAEDPDKARLELNRVKYANDERHKKLVADTDKLLALATELKAEVDKAGKDELSVTVVKRASEMEKLAHDVKQRMSN